MWIFRVVCVIVGPELSSTCSVDINNFVNISSPVHRINRVRYDQMRL